jgi:D-tyrosyl-tRNA(Tyr) deacylase
MRLLVQRIAEGWVDIEGVPTPHVGAGLLALIGLKSTDGPSHLEPMAKKLLHLRILGDAQGRMNRSLAEAGGHLLLVSQFTLYADSSQGRRPSFLAAMPPGQAEVLYDEFVTMCRQLCDPLKIPVITGKFGASMRVHLINDGPVTLMLDSAELGMDPRAL